MTSRRSSRIGLIARSVITVGLCALVISQLDMSRLRACLGELNYWHLLCAAVAVQLVMLLHCVKWTFIIRRTGRRLPFLTAVRATWGGSFVNHLLPGRLGGDLVRAYVARDVTGGMATGLGYLVLDRLCNLIAMLLTAAVVAPTANLPPLVRWGLVAAGVAVVPALLVAARVDLPFLKLRFGHLRGVANGCRLLTALQSGMRDPGLFFPLIAMGGMVMVLVTLVNLLVGRALGISVNFFTFWAIVALANTVTLLPVTLGGVGLREGLFAYLFASAGATLEQGMMLSLVARGLVMLCSLPGGGWLMMTESIPRKELASLAGSRDGETCRGEGAEE